MLQREQEGNLQLVYMSLFVLWGLGVLVFLEWHWEISIAFLFFLAWRGIRIEKMLNLSTTEYVLKEKQKNPRHGVYYRRELGYVSVSLMLMAAMQLVWALRARL